MENLQLGIISAIVFIVLRTLEKIVWEWLRGKKKGTVNTSSFLAVEIQKLKEKSRLENLAEIEKHLNIINDVKDLKITQEVFRKEYREDKILLFQKLDDLRTVINRKRNTHLGDE
jgi:hypothetical protein